MSEEKPKNPMDFNGDGEVSIGEALKYAAQKAKEEAKGLYEKAAPKVKEACEEAKENAKDLYDKAAPKVKEVLEEARENANEYAEKAKSKFQDFRDKRQHEDSNNQ